MSTWSRSWISGRTPYVCSSSESIRIIRTQPDAAKRSGPSRRGGEFIDRYLQPEAMDRAVLVCSTIRRAVALLRRAGRSLRWRRRPCARRRIRTSFSGSCAGKPTHGRASHLRKRRGAFDLSRQSRAPSISATAAAFIDVGGGSTEVIAGDQRQYHLPWLAPLARCGFTTLFFLPNEVRMPVRLERYALLSAMFATHRFLRFSK